MILRAGWVLPVDAPPIRDGYVAIHQGRIRGVGAWAQRPMEDRDLIDLGPGTLAPGLVNPHTHLELTCYEGKIAPAPFWSWIGGVIPLRRAPGQIEREQAAAESGAWRLLRDGVTCVGDISRLNIAWPALKRVPIRKICFVELLTLADAAPRTPAELQTAVESVEEDELLTVGVTPHAPYSVPLEHFAAAVALARRIERPWTTHLAETREERDFLAGDENALPAFLRELASRHAVRSPRTSPGDFVARLADEVPPGALAHLNYADENDAAALAAGGHVAVVCPRAHHYFGHPPHPWRRLRERGLRVALGTDSAASNVGLSLRDELRFLLEQGGGELTDADGLRMITLEAAAALGLEGRIGSLTPGKQADLAWFESPGGMNDPYDAIVGEGAACRGVWVAGRRV